MLTHASVFLCCCLMDENFYILTHLTGFLFHCWFCLEGEGSSHSELCFVTSRMFLSILCCGGLNNICLNIISLTPTSHIQYLKKIDKHVPKPNKNGGLSRSLPPALSLSVSLSHTHTHTHTHMESFRVSLDPNLSVSHRVIEKHFEAFCKSDSTAGRGPEGHFSSHLRSSFS